MCFLWSNLNFLFNSNLFSLFTLSPLLFNVFPYLEVQQNAAQKDNRWPYEYIIIAEDKRNSTYTVEESNKSVFAYRTASRLSMQGA